MRGLTAIGGWVLGLIVLGVVVAALTSGVQWGAKKPLAQAAMSQTCPPIVSMAPRGPGQPVDDILGVRLGYTVSDLTATLDCIDDGYKYRFEPVWHTMTRKAERDQRQLLYAERKRELLAAGLVGGPGQERTAALWRTVQYAPDEAPPRAAPEAELTRHFGAPHMVEESKLRRVLIWSYDPNGLPLKAPTKAEGAGAIFAQVNDLIAGVVTVPQCTEHLKASPLDRPDFSAKCGLTIRAEIEGSLEAPDKASSVKLAMADQARAKTMIDAQRKLTEGRP